MEKIIQDFLGQIKVGRKQSFKNLVMYPLLSDYSLPFDYRTLDDALAEDLIEIVEVDKEGSVPELKVINRSSEIILIIDGEELVGAKQNRIINITVLISGNTTIIIPVSCVEQGRWSYDSPEFSSEKRIMSPGLRAMKAGHVSFSIREEGHFRSDQGAIWDEISDKSERMEAPSESMAIADIYRKEKPAIEQYVKGFKLLPFQSGAVFMINGKVVGVDCFGKNETFSKVFKKLLESYALDAIDGFEPEKEFKALKSSVTRFLQNTAAAKVEKHPSVGLGDDLRIESKKVTGFALCHNNKVPHLSIFTRNPDIGKGKPSAGMGRFSQRRDYRIY